jgi:hypothetical protein
MADVKHCETRVTTPRQGSEMVYGKRSWAKSMKCFSWGGGGEESFKQKHRSQENIHFVFSSPEINNEPGISYEFLHEDRFYVNRPTDLQIINYLGNIVDESTVTKLTTVRTSELISDKCI